MHLFNRLVAVALLVMGGILAWDLSQERLAYPGKKLIVYAGMFGPGEPMQKLYAGPAPAAVSRQPFGPDHLAHYDALMRAWPRRRDAIAAGYERVHGRPYPRPRRCRGGPAARTGEAADLVRLYRRLDPAYVDQLVRALGESDRANRLRLFQAFADAHPQFDVRPSPTTQPAPRFGVLPKRGPIAPGSAHGGAEPGAAPPGLILTFERLHPTYQVGLFEDFERRHPEHKIVQRWDGRWVLSANRPRFLTGSDVPDIITGALSELRILMRENLGVPLGRPLPWAEKESWRKEGILRGESAYGDPSRSFESEFYDWALAKSRYTITEEDVTVSANPFGRDERVLYFLPRQVHTYVVFYNKAHFRLIGRDPNAPPKTVAEFEEVCRKLLAAGKEPIANDGISYIAYWWDWQIFRQIGNANYVDTVLNRPGVKRFAGPDADARYRQIAQRLRRWRDEDFWMKGFSSSQWPAAQKDFGNGKCTFLFTGSWLPAEIESTRSTNPAVFELGCFFFPKVREGPRLGPSMGRGPQSRSIAIGDPRTGVNSPPFRQDAEAGGGDTDAIQVSPQGYVLCRQGANTESAVLLLRYLTAYGGDVIAGKLNYISTTRGVAFPSALHDVEDAFNKAALDEKRDRFLGDGPAWYAPKFAQFVLNETYPKFFLIRESNSLDPGQFVEELERRAQAHYRQFGGQAR